MLSPVRHVLRTAHKGGRVAVPFEQQARPASPLVSRVFVLTRRRSISLHRSAHALKHLRPMARSTSFTLSLIYFNMMFFDSFFFEKYSEECFAMRVPRARDCTRGNRRAPRLPSHKAGGGSCRCMAPICRRRIVTGAPRVPNYAVRVPPCSPSERQAAAGAAISIDGTCSFTAKGTLVRVAV